MRFKFIFPILLFMVFSAVSCKKNLEETAYSFLSANTVFSTEAGLRQATLGVYDSWRADPPWDIFYQWILAEVGQQYVTAGMGGDQMITPFYGFSHNPTDLNVTHIWPRIYQTIARANTVVAHADEAVSDEAIANTYKAEAQFSRAYAYFNLVRLFGGVPLIKSEVNSIAQKDEIFGTQAAVQDIYDFIIEDLKFAESHLPPFWTDDNLGRISAGAAKALLGKVYLTGAGLPLQKAEYYQLAVSKLSEITGSGEATYNFGLLPDFLSVFADNNRKNKEVIFAWTNLWTSTYSHSGTIVPYFLFPPGLVGTVTQTLYGTTPGFYNLYESTDIRRNVTAMARYLSLPAGDSIIYDFSANRYRNETQGGYIVGNTLLPYTGLAYSKFGRTPLAASQASVPTDYSTDLIQMRFSDVLLCLAEALNETGQTAQAVPFLNRVRERANASQYPVGSQDEVRAQIRKERRLELTGEYTTVFDIRRWGTLQDEISAMDPAQILNNALSPYSPKLELYPIPQAELDANPNLTQNPGW
ncbi:RagB/SusD family nutrient uptake outer membrane protein [Agriterribacter sp.]|uniref:RagB/SusD family nutrient uptake outer membrane protein n=1 Tax=Agriterribacter sp. TaxID=2821509 RepID=UPI002C8B0937|nr:RagB/SusD family nutrient uptake outer membrane protein [Agriterribacter sp.]HRP57051.1 RagB/SusD family nutrient uptake outer membrane protein [Agriterribacter sp.]